MRIFGKNPAIERLRFNPSSIKKIYIEEGFSETSYIYEKAKKNKISVYVLSKQQMARLGRNVNTQGIFVDIGEFEYADYDELLQKALEKKRSLVFLDSLTDPQNFGAILRSLACLGKFSVVLPVHDSVSVTEAVLRVASGGENYVPIARVNNLNNAIKEAKKEGFTIMGAVLKEGELLSEAQWRHPLGLVIGSEYKGIRPLILREVDVKVTITMTYPTISLNVSQAVTILAHEIVRRSIR